MTGAVRQPLHTRLRPAHWMAIDAAAAMVFLIFFWGVPRTPGHDVPLVAGYGLVLAATLPIAVRRVWPLPTFAVVLAADMAAVLLQLVPIPTPMVAVVGYTVAVHASRRVAVGALVVALAADVVLAVALPGLPGSGIAGGATVPFATLTLAAWCLGIAAKSQREYAARRPMRSRDPGPTRRAAPAASGAAR